MAGDSTVKILSQKVEFASPHMDILLYEVEDIKGRKKPYWVLDRKNNFSVVIPIFPDNTTVLVGQFRVPINEYSWEFAMGTVDNATPEATAEQELREETGITAKKFEKIGQFFPASGISTHIGYVFLAKELTLGQPTPEEDEELETKRVSFDEVGKMIRNQEIKDGPTIIAWQFLQDYQLTF